MSFLDKIKGNKQMVWAVVGGMTVGYLLYKLVQGSPKVETPEQRRKRQIEVLKRGINLDNPSFQDVKKVMQYAIHEAKIKVAKYSQQFRERRMKFNRVTRKQNFKQYLDLIEEGTHQMQMIAIREQHQLLKELRISQIHFRKYNKLLDKAMQDIMNIESKDISHITPMKLQDVKFAFRQQIQFIKKQGLEYAQLIIDATKNWTPQKKADLPLLLSMMVTDCAFESYPQLNADSVEHASAQFEKQLMGELQQLQVAMAPMMIKLNSAIKEVSGFDLADFRDVQSRMDYEQASKLRQYQKEASTPLFKV